MGAVAGKAAEQFAAKTEAEVRLVVAEHEILQWNRSPGTDTGIWDAQAAYTNRGLLAAVDEILNLAEIQPFHESSAARRRLDGALGVATSRMVDEFLRLRVWNASQSQLRAAVEKLSVSLPASRVSLAFPGSSGTTSAGTTSTAADPYASGGSRSSTADEVAALFDGEFLEELDLICPASVSVLHEIAHRVIRANHAEKLLQAFTNAPCDILDRFLSILQVECSRWTTELVIKRWTLATKLVGKAIVLMQRQLYAQDSGAFDGFRDDYLLAITKNRILILLKFADGFTTITSHEKLIYILGMYEALSNAAPSLLLLFSGANKELISRQSEHIRAKLAAAIRVMVGSLIDKIGSDCSHAQSAADGGVGVHLLTRYVMTCVELLAPHRDALDLILADGGAATSLADLVSRLIWCLDCNLEEKPALCGAGEAGSRQLFLANNANFVLKRAADADVTPLLGHEWAARRRSRIDQHVASYLEASWAPVVAYLEAVGRRKPARVLAKFCSELERAYNSQACCEVPDPALRAAVRKAVSEMVVPVYHAYLQKHPKLERSAGYTADKLKELLSELFEGEAAERKKA